MGSGVGKPTAVDQTTRTTQSTTTSRTSRSNSTQHSSRTSRSNSTHHSSRTSRSNSTQHQAPSTSAAESNQTLSQGLNPSTSSQLQETDDAEMVCEACSASFTIFKRKYRCLDCEKHFCSNCIHKEPRKCCMTCRLFEGLVTRGDVMQVKLKDLRQFLQLRNISIETCKEKGDLVDLVAQHLGLSTTPHILPQSSSNSPRRVVSEPPRQSSVTSTSTDDAIPITEPNTSTTARPTRIGGNEEPMGQPSVHIYGETPLGPMRHAWNDDASSPDGQSEASPDMDEFPEIINIPNQGTNTQSQASDGADGSTSQAAKINREHIRGTDEWYNRPASIHEFSENSPIQTINGATLTDEEDDEAVPESAPPKQSTGGPSRQQRASVSDIKSVLDIESLTIKQMKEILSRNFVDYKGCVERYELEERVRRLFTEKQEFKQREEKAAAVIKDTKNGGAEDIYDLDPDVCCKICMDAPIDCVLLECGHMVTCSKCGKRLAECPICRQYVVRAVHVFKS